MQVLIGAVKWTQSIKGVSVTEMSLRITLINSHPDQNMGRKTAVLQVIVEYVMQLTHFLIQANFQAAVPVSVMFNGVILCFPIRNRC